jgi:hypothetical protein
MTRSPLHQPGRRRQALRRCLTKTLKKAAEEKEKVPLLQESREAHLTFFFRLYLLLPSAPLQIQTRGRFRNVSQIPGCNPKRAPPPRLSETEAFYSSPVGAAPPPPVVPSPPVSLGPLQTASPALPPISPAATMNGGGGRRRYSSEHLLFDAPANAGAGRWAPQQVRPNGSSRSAWSPGSWFLQG